MKHLIYVSCASAPFTDDDLKTLLESSRKNNAGMGITGMLLYADGNFIQVIEGEDDIIDSLSAKITRDCRHKSFLVLVNREIKQRSFADWSMGFKKITQEDFFQIEGFKNLAASSPDALSQLNTGLVLLLLKNFLKVNTIEGRYTQYA